MSSIFQFLASMGGVLTLIIARPSFKNYYILNDASFRYLFVFPLAISETTKPDSSKVVAALLFPFACFWCQSFGDDSLCMFILFLVRFGLLSGHPFGKST